MTTPTSPSLKRRAPSHDHHSPLQDELLHHSAGAGKAASPPNTASSAASSFRNVSACNRCRLRKNRCDQKLPSCTACEKAHTKCVGYDPITKREIPRSYVYYLESRVSYLESLLQTNGIPFDPPEDFASTPRVAGAGASANGDGYKRSFAGATSGAAEPRQNEGDKVSNLLSHASRVAVQGASDSRFLGSTSGISFARVVFAAVKSSVSGAASERAGVRPSKPLTGATGATSMRDSFFGLHTKPTIKPAKFPSKELGLRLVKLYFEHANPQIPILHLIEFMDMFEKVYSSDEHSRSARESYMLNIVFAIGAGIIVGKSPDDDNQPSHARSSSSDGSDSPPNHKRRKITEEQAQPEEYHASAIVHLENFLSSSAALERPDGIGGSLEELQAVLLLAGFALLRPVAPGLWYIVGVAVRLAVDLGLHSEDWADNDIKDVSEDHRNPDVDLIGKPNGTEKTRADGGRRQYISDFRRRLWWCVYSFDRLVSTCVGRPFGITDQVITTEFPTILNDRHITSKGFLKQPTAAEKPSYKLVAYQYFRLRLLQSEILQVLQHRQAQQARERGVNRHNPYMHIHLPSPFLRDFRGSFKLWRADIDRRLWEWKESAPTQEDTGVAFSPLFLELNYWQAVIMLYRQSLTVPSVLAEELQSTNEDIQSPAMVNIEEQEDEEAVFLKVAEAGQKVLKLYRQLHRIHLVNYTFLATHHLFMAGISFLYAIWHSPTVRSQLSLDDVDFTVLAATSVLDDLIEKCPPAEACRDAFVRMSKATIKMCLSTGGFGAQGSLGNHPPPPQSRLNSTDLSAGDEMGMSLNPNAPYFTNPQSTNTQKREPVFDYDLRDLFSDEESATRQFSRLKMPQQSNAFSSQPYPFMGSPQQGKSQFNAFQTNLTSSAMSSPSLIARVPSSGPFQQSPSFSAALPNSGLYNNFSNTIQTQYSTMSPFSDLDFLDTLPLGANNTGGTSGNNQTSGFADFDMNFGMGWDGSLPGPAFEDGGGVDLFDGFFFGGTNGG